MRTPAVTHVSRGRRQTPFVSVTYVHTQGPPIDLCTTIAVGTSVSYSLYIEFDPSSTSTK